MYVLQADIKLFIFLPQPPKFQDDSHALPHTVSFCVLRVLILQKGMSLPGLQDIWKGFRWNKSFTCKTNKPKSVASISLSHSKLTHLLLLIIVGPGTWQLQATSTTQNPALFQQATLKLCAEARPALPVEIPGKAQKQTSSHSTGPHWCSSSGQVWHGHSGRLLVGSLH